MPSDMFLKADGIDGESTAEGHVGEIVISSYSVGAKNTSGMGGGTNKAVLHDINITFPANKASASLFKATVNGDKIKKCVITVRKAGGKQEDYITITLEDVLVSTYHHGTADDQEVALDSVTLNFQTIKFAYAEQKDDGSIEAVHEAGWDVAAGQGN